MPRGERGVGRSPATRAISDNSKLKLLRRDEIRVSFVSALMSAEIKTVNSQIAAGTELAAP